MSDSRPPLPLILGAGAALVVLGGLGLVALKKKEGGGAVELEVKPPPAVASPSAKPKVVGEAAQDDALVAAERETLSAARRLMTRSSTS